MDYAAITYEVADRIATITHAGRSFKPERGKLLADFYRRMERENEPRPDRADFLAKVAAQWQSLDADEYSFTRSVANQLREHDDRAEFLAGIDLILAGIAASL